MSLPQKQKRLKKKNSGILWCKTEKRSPPIKILTSLPLCVAESPMGGAWSRRREAPETGALRKDSLPLELVDYTLFVAFPIKQWDILFTSRSPRLIQLVNIKIIICNRREFYQSKFSSVLDFCVCQLEYLYILCIFIYGTL